MGNLVARRDKDWITQGDAHPSSPEDIKAYSDKNQRDSLTLCVQDFHSNSQKIWEGLGALLKTQCEAILLFFQRDLCCSASLTPHGRSPDVSGGRGGEQGH